MNMTKYPKWKVFGVIGLICIVIGFFIKAFILAGIIALFIMSVNYYKEKKH